MAWPQLEMSALYDPKIQPGKKKEPDRSPDPISISPSQYITTSNREAFATSTSSGSIGIDELKTFSV